jgi:hypothetical protein
MPLVMARGVGDIATLRERVRVALDEEKSLLDVERNVVEPARLDPEDRAALWLYAWYYSDRRDGRGRRALIGASFRRR